jgi:hypothetical protein
MMKIALVMGACALVCFAAATPEKIIADTPKLPTAQDLALVDGNDYENPQLAAAQKRIEDFKAAIERLENELGKAAEAAAESIKDDALAQANQATKGQYGKSVDDLKNMSDSDRQKLARQQMDTKMAEAQKMMGGMSFVDMEKMMQSGMSEEDMAAKFMSQSSMSMGLTETEIKALQKMSEAEAEVYMRQGDRAARVQAAEQKYNKERPNAAKEAQADQKKADEILKGQEADKRWQTALGTLNKDVEATRTKADKDVKAIWEKKYDKEVKTLRDKMRKNQCSEALPDPRADRSLCPKQGEQIKTMQKQFYLDAYTAWRESVTQIQARTKRELEAANAYDKARGFQDRRTAYMIASSYINAAKEIIPAPSLDAVNASYGGY